MKHPLEVEREFDVIFNAIGFERVSFFVGQSPTFQNADYIRKADRYFIELKIIDKNYFKGGGLIHRLHAIVGAPVDVKPDRTGLYKITIPEKGQDESRDLFEESIQRTLKKANRQLKETKQHFFGGEGKGFIVLVMNGFTSLEPFMLARMVFELFRENLSNISGFIVCVQKPNLWCGSGMHPDLPSDDYNKWYAIAEHLGECLERRKDCDRHEDIYH